MLSVCRYCFKPYLYIKPISPNVNLLLLSIFHTEETQGQEGTRNCPVARGIQCGVRMWPHTSFRHFSTQEFLSFLRGGAQI